MAATHPLSGDVLAGLQELPPPQPVPYVPQTFGWLIVAIVLVLLIACTGWLLVKHWRANAYRRQALAELNRIEAAFRAQAPVPSSKAIAAPASAAPRSAAAPALASRGEAGWGALPALLKRTAMAATSREQVASLTGDDWLRFLDRTLNSDAFVCGAGRLLPRLAYSQSLPADISTQDLDQLMALSRRWIRHHDARRAAIERDSTGTPLNGRPG